VFSTRDGNRCAFWPKLQFDRARKAAGLKGGPHTLRHTFASHFLKQVPDLFLLARVLGHSDTRVTKLYAHVLPEHLARARNAVRFGPPVRSTAKEKAAKRWKVDPADVCKADPVRTVPGERERAKTRRRTNELARRKRKSLVELRGFFYLVEPWGIEPQTSRVRF